VQVHFGDVTIMAREVMLVMTDETSPYSVRADLVAAHARAWDRLARPGTWLDGPTRIWVAAETRHAPGCALCMRRKAALSPYAMEARMTGAASCGTTGSR